MGEWKEVRRRSAPQTPVPAAIGIRFDPVVTSFYVCNLPGGATEGDIWKQCAKRGNLVDVYIVGRRDATGSFFAFFRYLDVEKPECIVAGLNEVTRRGRKLRANSAKNLGGVSPAVPYRAPHVKPSAKWRPASTDARSFADVVGGKETRSNRPSPTVVASPVALTVIPELQEWFDNGVLVGVSKSLDVLCSFPSLLDLEGFDVMEVKYGGGMNIVMKFSSPRAAEIFKSNKNVWLKWFCKVEHYGKQSFVQFTPDLLL